MGNWTKNVLGSRAVFCALVAFLMVFCRFVLFDHRYLSKETLPNHDMSEALPYFTTSMHSLRLSGDIAWWNPADTNGYAQYFQSFLAPVAPTPHHLSYILWGQAVRGLARLGIAIPEYRQYILINFLVLPYLTFAALTLFLSFVFHSRATVFAVVTTYTFSGIGLWNSAWFYFQEPFSFFLLLAGLFGALRWPGPRTILLFLGALLVQLTSINYWTIYNVYFLAILIGSYAWIYPSRFHRLGRVAARLVGRHKTGTAVLGAALAAVVILWIVMIGSLVVEQNENYIRPETSTLIEVSHMGQELRKYTLELFNASILRALYSYAYNNVMHNAHYIGCALFPFLILLPLRRWGRRDRWLVAATCGVLLVCLCPPLLLEAWNVTPFMNRIRWIFQFYQQYWAFMVVLLAGAGLDVLLRQRYSTETKRRFVMALTGFAVALAVLLLGYGCFSQFFHYGDVNLEATLRFAVVTLPVTLGCLQLLLYPSRQTRNLFAAAVLAIMGTDVTKYFWEVSPWDRQVTIDMFRWPNPPSDALRATLGTPWPTPDSSEGFEGGLGRNLPIANIVWPRNRFMVHRYLREVQKSRLLDRLATEGPPLSFYESAQPMEDVDVVDRLFQATPELLRDRKVLLLQSESSARLPPETRAAQQPATSSGETEEHFRHEWNDWIYNTFSFTVFAPKDGWLFIRQVFDPVWSLTVDGASATPTRANFAGMGLPLTKGMHVIRMEYWPLARRLYWPACYLLEATLLGILVASLRTGRAQRARWRSRRQTVCPPDNSASESGTPVKRAAA